MEAHSVRIGWKIMLIHGIYLLILGLLFSVAPEIVFREEFEAFTGQTWTGFATANPGLASFFKMYCILAGVMILGIALACIAIALNPYRKGERWSWYTFLVVGIICWGYVLAHHIIVGMIPSVMIMIIVGILLFAVALVLPARAILSKKLTS